MRMRFIGASFLLSGAVILSVAVAEGLTNAPPRATGDADGIAAIDLLRTGVPVAGANVRVAEVSGTGQRATGASRLASPMWPAASPGVVLEVGPFVGDLTESFEGFQNYLDNPGTYEPSPATIFGGEGTIANVNDRMAIYEPSAGATFGLSSSGQAQVADGTKGLGLDIESTLAHIEFAEPVYSFGAFWGCSTSEVFGDPNEIAIAFFGVQGNLIAVTGFPYSRSQQGADGLLEWHGWRASEPVAAIEYAGDFVVTDGMQANLASPCDGRHKILDFEKLEVVNNLVNSWGYHYEEDGYQFDKEPAGPEFATWGALATNYPGSTALFNNEVDGVTVLTRMDGTSFDIRTIDIAPLLAPDPVVVRFIGLRADGGVITSTFQHSGSGVVLERHFFPSNFKNLVSLEWVQLGPFHQFDNVGVDCGPCNLCPCPEDVDRDGRVAFSDILRILAAWGDCDDPSCPHPETCGGFEPCALGEPFDCFCWTTFDGGGVCYQNFPCNTYPECPDGNCPPGFVCVVESCCEVPTCIPEIDCSEPALIPAAWSGGLTGSGQFVDPAPASFGMLGDTAAPFGTAAVVEPVGARTIFLERGPNGGNAPMNVAYDPEFAQYYASDGGNIAFAAWVYDAAGTRIQDFDPIGIDVRAWNDVPNGRMEILTFDAQGGDGGNVRGLVVPGRDGSGLLTGTVTNIVSALPGLNGSQTMPAYDPDLDVFYSRDTDSIVHVVRRPNGALVTTIALDFVAAGVTPNNVVLYAIGFDRRARCLVVGDHTNDRALVFDLDGTFLGASQLDVDVLNAYRLGYTNGQLFVFDQARNGWQGYIVKNLDPCAGCPCPEDINRDGTVSFADILRVLAAWGPCPGDCDDCEDGFIDRCDDEEICHECETPDGACVCVLESACDPDMACPDGNCPPGFFCCTNTCCGFNICLPVCEVGADTPEFEPGALLSGGGHH